MVMIEYLYSAFTLKNDQSTEHKNIIQLKQIIKHRNTNYTHKQIIKTKMKKI